MLLNKRMGTLGLQAPPHGDRRGGEDAVERQTVPGSLATVDLPILFDRHDVLAVAKPEGLAAIPERRDDPDCLHARLSRQCGQRLWAVHRLDKEVSGVILFARTAGMHRTLCLLFEQRHVRKTYLALVHGNVSEASGTIDLPLREYGSGRIAVDRQRGKPSVTDYRVVERFDALTLLEVSPRTGRRHQIRAHLYALGHAIVGDERYGDRAVQRTFARLMLHAMALALHLPDGPAIAIEACRSETFDAGLAACR